MAILLIITLALLIVTDFKFRYVYIWQLILFAAVQLIFCLLTLGKQLFVQNVLINGVAFLFLACCVAIYTFFRFRKKRKVIGWGDILFIFALTPYFSLYSFLIFMTIAMLLTLAGWFIFYLNGHRSKDIPLVSTLGICYCFLLIFQMIVSG